MRIEHDKNAKKSTNNESISEHRAHIVSQKKLRFKKRGKVQKEAETLIKQKGTWGKVINK